MDELRDEYNTVNDSTAPSPRRRPGGRPKRIVDIDEARRLLRAGRSLRQTAETMRLGYGTLHRALHGQKAA